MKETIRYTQRRDGQHDRITEDEASRMLVSFIDRAGAIAWIEDRAHPDHYELLVEIMQGSSGSQAWELFQYHVLKREGVPVCARQCDPEKQYEYKFLSRAVVEHGFLPLEDQLNQLSAEGWRVLGASARRSMGNDADVWQLLLERRVRNVVQFADPVKQKQVVNPQLVSFSEAVCRMYDGQWFQSADNPRAAYGLVQGELMCYEELKTSAATLCGLNKAEVTLDLVTARWYQVQKPVT